MKKLSKKLRLQIKELGEVGIGFDKIVWWKEKNEQKFIELAQSMLEHGYSESEVYFHLKRINKAVYDEASWSFKGVSEKVETSEVPVLLEHNNQKRIGQVLFYDTKGKLLNFQPNYYFDPAFIKKEDGSLELKEISLVLGKKK